MLTSAPIANNVYTATPKQSKFHHAVRKYEFVLFNGGRGSGKTTAGAIQSTLEAVEYQPGKRGIIVAPTYPMLEDATMKEFFAWCPRHWIVEHNKQRKLVTLFNGSEIAFRSADDADSLRGPNRAWAWFDEPRNLRGRDAFDIVTAQLRPTRKLWLTTTPAGIFHWLYDLFIEHPLQNSKWIHVKTSENPHLPKEYEDGLRALYTDTFAQQELDAEWVSFEGRVYDNFSLTENVTTGAEYNPNLPVLWGVDDGYALGEGIGKPSYHPRVFVLAQATAIGGINIFAEYFAVLELPEKSIDNLFAGDYKIPEVAYVDSSAAELKARLNAKGIQTVGATHPVGEGIKNVRRMICDGNGVRLLKIHPRCTNTIREFQLYRSDPNSKQVRVGEITPYKCDDHSPDATRYLCWHLRFSS